MTIRHGDASDRVYDNYIYPACDAYAKAKVEAFRSQWDSYRSSENATFPELYRANAFNVEAYGDGGIEGGLERKEGEIYNAAYTEKLSELTSQQDQSEFSWTKAEFEQWTGVDYKLGADAQEMRDAQYVVAAEKAFPGEMDPVVVRESAELLHSDSPEMMEKRQRAVQQEAAYEQKNGAELDRLAKGRYREPAEWMKTSGVEEAHAKATAELSQQLQPTKSDTAKAAAPAQASGKAEDAKAVQVLDQTGRVVGERVGERITMRHTDQAAIRAGLDNMQARGKNAIRVTGNEEFRRAAAIEATARGMRVKGYEMTDADRQAARERRAEITQQHEDVRAASTGEESLEARTAEHQARAEQAKNGEGKKQEQEQGQQQQQPEAQKEPEETLGIRSAGSIAKESFQESKQIQERELAEKANAERGQAAGVHGGQVAQAPAPAEQQKASAPLMSERMVAQSSGQQRGPQPSMSERAIAQRPEQSYAAAKMSERTQAVNRDNPNRGNDESRVARLRASQQRGQEQLQTRAQTASHERER